MKPAVLALAAVLGACTQSSSGVPTGEIVAVIAGTTDATGRTTITATLHRTGLSPLELGPGDDFYAEWDGRRAPMTSTGGDGSFGTTLEGVPPLAEIFVHLDRAEEASGQTRLVVPQVFEGIPFEQDEYRRDIDRIWVRWTPALGLPAAMQITVRGDCVQERVHNVPDVGEFDTTAMAYMTTPPCAATMTIERAGTAEIDRAFDSFSRATISQQRSLGFVAL